MASRGSGSQQQTQQKWPPISIEKPPNPREIKGLAVVPVAGVEPARHRWRRILSPLRLPIPSYRQIGRVFGKMWEIGGHFGGQEAKIRSSDFKKPRKNQGFSAARCQLAHRILSPLRLPIPSYRQICLPCRVGTDGSGRNGIVSRSMGVRTDWWYYSTFRAE